MLISINSTEDALEFGRTCDPEMLPKMYELHQVLTNFSRQAQLQMKTISAMQYACKAGFIREAIEVVEARDRKEASK